MTTQASRHTAVQERIWSSLSAGDSSILVDSPPGAGKSTLVRELVSRLAKEGPVPIAVQTNNQADDMCRGFIAEAPSRAVDLKVGRLHGQSYTPPKDLQSSSIVQTSNSLRDLHECDVLVAPSAKWGTVSGAPEFTQFVIDEAYQMQSRQLIPIGHMTDRLLLVGDPGQIAPFSTVDDSAFRDLDFSPIETAAISLLKSQPQTTVHTLPSSWRLSPSAAGLVSSSFYLTEFEAGHAAGYRTAALSRSLVRSVARSATHAAINDGWVSVELEEAVMPTDGDPQMVESICNQVVDLLQADIALFDGNATRSGRSITIAVGVSHSWQESQIKARLTQLVGGGVAERVSVGTANKLQGREFDFVLVWHPLSGRRNATEFHLDAGRLCVLLSRHRYACFVFSRAGVREQLLRHPGGDVTLSDFPVNSVDGWDAHLRVLDHLGRFTIAA